MEGSPYRRSPFIVIWEMTRACDLACRHCRAEAVRRRDPAELTTAEARWLIDDVATMDPPPIFVLTGGDPMKRPDLVELIRYAARERHLRVSMTPSATPLVTPAAVRACVEAGLTRWAFSLDGPDAATHDRFRGQAGSFDLTLRAVEELHRLGLRLQVNTTVSRYNRDMLPRIGELAERLRATLWAVFFLVPVGRARVQDTLNAAETEAVLHWLDGFARASRCDVKTTEAPQWNRVRGWSAAAAAAPGDGVGRAPRPVSDGDGFIFVDHRGLVYPSGFLPLVVGDVRQRPLSEIYRTAPELEALRDRSRLRGKCRWCEFREVCGGSRARAHAVTGDPLESDPFCPHMPDPAHAWSQAHPEQPAVGTAAGPTLLPSPPGPS